MTNKDGFQPLAIEDSVRAIVNVNQITRITPTMNGNSCMIHLADGNSLAHNVNFNEMAKKLESKEYLKFYVKN